eukprot:4609699-Pyramimonas_sp.AAC.1
MEHSKQSGGRPGRSFPTARRRHIGGHIASQSCFCVCEARGLSGPGRAVDAVARPELRVCRTVRRCLCVFSWLTPGSWIRRWLVGARA